MFEIKVFKYHLCRVEEITDSNWKYIGNDLTLIFFSTLLLIFKSFRNNDTSNIIKNKKKNKWASAIFPEPQTVKTEMFVIPHFHTCMYKFYATGNC